MASLGAFGPELGVELASWVSGAVGGGREA